MDVQYMIDHLVQAAKIAAIVIPGTEDDAIIEAAQKLDELIEGLVHSTSDHRTQEEMQLARKELARVVSAKADATAKKLEG